MTIGRAAAAAALFSLLLAGVFVSRAAAQDEGFIDTDSIPKTPTTYDTSYDRDRTRGMWTQTIALGSSGKHSLFTANGSVSTMDYLRSNSKSTTGSILGTLNLYPIGNLITSVTGRYGMTSSMDGRSGLDNRDNQLNLKAQYAWLKPALQTRWAVYTEFGQRHDRNHSDATRPGEFDAEDRVDSTAAQRDSSYTSSRMDGINGNYMWTVRPWLTLNGRAQGYRIYPTITSFSRTFVHPLDGSPGSYSTEVVERSRNPTGNTSFTQDVTFTRIRLTKVDLHGERRRLAQSYFDKQRARQESARLETNVGRVQVSSFLKPFSFYVDAGLSRQLNAYALNTNQNKLSRNQRLFTMVMYGDSASRRSVGVHFVVERSRTELNPNVNGVELNRTLGGTARIPTGRRLILDASANLSLFSNDFEKDRNDRDIQRSALSVGGGYMLAPSCSTTVHFSRTTNHTVDLDPELSGLNAMTTTYQMTATMQYLPNRNFSLRQNYVMSAEYRILDYAEVQNSLQRVRRIETDMADTMLSVVFVRLAHNFVFRDQGTYARFDESADRLYRVASRAYDQTLTVTAGLKIAPGVTFAATQNLLNNRTNVLAGNTRNLQNTWKLNVGLEVSRTFSDGMGIEGAVRRIEEYVENSKSGQPRRDWVAGVSFHKGF